MRTCGGSASVRSSHSAVATFTAVGVHFTWKMMPEDVAALLPDIEAILLPLGARPHWGKVFAATAEQLEPLYPRLGDFRALARRHDPDGVFGNDFLARKIGL